MDQVMLDKMVRAGKMTVNDVVARAPMDKLDDTLTMLRRHRAAQEVCAALMERIKRAPLNDFEGLKDLYFKHSGM